MQHVRTYHCYFDFACKKQQISRDVTWDELLGRAVDWLKICFIQSGAQFTWRVIRMEFLRLFLRRHFAGKPVVASWNVGFFSPCTCKEKEIVMEISTCRLRSTLWAGSLLSWSVEQNAWDTQMTTRMTEGARRESPSFFLSGCRPRFLRARALVHSSRSLTNSFSPYLLFQL